MEFKSFYIHFWANIANTLKSFIIIFQSFDSYAENCIVYLYNPGRMRPGFLLSDAGAQDDALNIVLRDACICGCTADEAAPHFAKGGTTRVTGDIGLSGNGARCRRGFFRYNGWRRVAARCGAQQAVGGGEVATV